MFREYKNKMSVVVYMKTCLDLIVHVIFDKLVTLLFRMLFLHSLEVSLSRSSSLSAQTSSRLVSS
jgi:hypothetical protein